MKAINRYFAIVLVALLAVGARAWAADAPAAKEDWYKNIVDLNYVKSRADLPLPGDVMLVDSRPVRKFDEGHIPGSVNIPDTQFDKMVDRLPAEKGKELIFYCGGTECMLSHKSAMKAEALGYTNIKVYAAGYPDWLKAGGQMSVSTVYVKARLEEGGKFVLVDARPARKAQEGMVPGAVNVPESQFDKLTDKLPADKATELVFYCGGFACDLSTKSAVKAQKLGYTNVKVYAAGYPDWQKQGGAGGAAIKAGKSEGSISVESFEQIVKDKSDGVLLVDVRDAKEFGRGTIKGAVNIPIGELEKRIATLPADKPIVFICGTGARSGEAYDMVKLVRPELKQVYFLDAELKFNGDGSFKVSKGS